MTNGRATPRELIKCFMSVGITNIFLFAKCHNNERKNLPNLFVHVFKIRNANTCYQCLTAFEL